MIKSLLNQREYGSIGQATMLYLLYEHIEILAHILEKSSTLSEEHILDIGLENSSFIHGHICGIFSTYFTLQILALYHNAEKQDTINSTKY